MSTLLLRKFLREREFLFCRKQGASTFAPNPWAKYSKVQIYQATRCEVYLPRGVAVRQDAQSPGECIMAPWVPARQARTYQVFSRAMIQPFCKPVLMDGAKVTFERLISSHILRDKESQRKVQKLFVEANCSRSRANSTFARASANAQFTRRDFGQSTSSACSPQPPSFDWETGRQTWYHQPVFHASLGCSGRVRGEVLNGLLASRR